MSGANVTETASLYHLYNDHHPWLRGWLKRRLGCPMDAEDLAHDTFIRIIRSPTPPEQVKEPRHFLVTIARGLTIDLFRRRSLERQYLEALSILPESHWPSEEERLLTLETLLELDAMLAGLGHNVREAFLLSQLDGQTYPQIATILGVSLRTVNNYMGRAMEHCCLYRLGLLSS